MKRAWALHPTPEAAQKLGSELKLHPQIAAILLRRGFKDSPEIFRFMQPSLNDLESPFVFRDMPKAVSRIKEAIARNEKLLIYGDYDVDGVTGSAVLYLALKKMGLTAEVYIPHRGREGYGLNKEALESLMKKKYSLVITVDNGITGISEIEYLNEKKADVIVVDHHLPKADLPPAFAILGSCVDEKGDSGLAACGLAFKLAWALAGDIEPVKDLLDLVVVGTVADLAPVTGDNRVILKHGLPVLASTRRPGLKALMEVAKISKENVSYRDIGFGIGPRINASGRMGSAEEAFRLLVTDNELLAANLAQFLDQGNRDRQQVELAAYEEAVERVERDFAADGERALVVESEQWHEGIIGIVAQRLVERYQKPAIVIALKGAEGKGSGRSTSHHKLYVSVKQCEEFLLSFGGHSMALGLKLERKKIPLFRKKLNELLAAEAPAASPLEIEGELGLHEIDFKFLSDLERLAPFGPGNRKPFFMSRGLKLRGTPKKRGQDILQCFVTDSSEKTTCEAVGFRAYGKWMKNPPAEPFELIYEPSAKEFNGIKTTELRLEDWR